MKIRALYSQLWKTACFLTKRRTNGGLVCSGGHAIWWKEWERICGPESIPLVIVNGNLTVQHYIDDILHPSVQPFLIQHQCIAMDSNVQQHPHPPVTPTTTI